MMASKISYRDTHTYTFANRNLLWVAASHRETEIGGIFELERILDLDLDLAGAELDVAQVSKELQYSNGLFFTLTCQFDFLSLPSKTLPRGTKPPLAPSKVCLLFSLLTKRQLVQRKAGKLIVNWAGQDLMAK